MQRGPRGTDGTVLAGDASGGAIDAPVLPGERRRWGTHAAERPAGIE